MNFTKHAVLPGVLSIQTTDESSAFSSPGLADDLPQGQIAGHGPMGLASINCFLACCQKKL